MESKVEKSYFLGTVSAKKRFFLGLRDNSDSYKAER